MTEILIAENRAERQAERHGFTRDQAGVSARRVCLQRRLARRYWLRQLARQRREFALRDEQKRIQDRCAANKMEEYLAPFREASLLFGKHIAN